MDVAELAFARAARQAGLIRADQADARAKAGETRPLLGVPIAVKDGDVAGDITAFGSGWPDRRPAMAS